MYESVSRITFTCGVKIHLYSISTSLLFLCWLDVLMFFFSFLQTVNIHLKWFYWKILISISTKRNQIELRFFHFKYAIKFVMSFNLNFAFLYIFVNCQWFSVIFVRFVNRLSIGISKKNLVTVMWDPWHWQASYVEASNRYYNKRGNEI